MEEAGLLGRGGSLGGKVTSNYNLRAGPEVLALSRKGSLMPRSDCGGVSNTDKMFVVSEWVSLETLGTRVLGFGSARRAEGWTVWVALAPVGVWLGYVC